jgi:hypothetical protein
MANSAAQFDTLGSAAVLIKNAAGTLFGYDVGSADGSPAMVLLYDKATCRHTGSRRASSQAAYPCRKPAPRSNLSCHK